MYEEIKSLVEKLFEDIPADVDTSCLQVACDGLLKRLREIDNLEATLDELARAEHARQRQE